MSERQEFLPLGYSDLAPGMIATMVTNLQMFEKSLTEPVSFPDGVTLEALVSPTPEAYRTLYCKIGTEWLWSSRILMPDEELAAILNRDSVEIYAVRQGSEDIGLLELDFSVPEECELGYFGLVGNSTGKGLGRALMSRASELAWSRPIKRFWVHTCTFDSPGALRFYIRSGFVPYSYQVEVQRDPRLLGILPMDVASHVPVIMPVEQQGS
ncbi:N-acetyltransferase [uncultured Cedecea sp.]|uniref:GNAT family N-acetyltransferase n=1 Tax=uncultured Cedecea sp. TaxID=988762 RepID=UPI002618C0EB|nr:GNAT family N-acetyltransferase [uncultured Cedecea sp.]